MKCTTRLAGLFLFALTVSALTLFLPNAARADILTYTYDDFNGTAIDSSKWTTYLYGSSTDLFTESGGTLNFTRLHGKR